MHHESQRICCTSCPHLLLSTPDCNHGTSSEFCSVRSIPGALGAERSHLSGPPPLRCTDVCSARHCRCFALHDSRLSDWINLLVPAAGFLKRLTAHLVLSECSQRCRTRKLGHPPGGGRWLAPQGWDCSGSTPAHADHGSARGTAGHHRPKVLHGTLGLQKTSQLKTRSWGRSSPPGRMPRPV